MTTITLSLYGKNIRSNNTINILGVIFDSKMQWSDHISHAIKRSMKALNAIRLIRKFVMQRELLDLVTSNFYSILFYNSEIWHLPTIKSTLKKACLVHLEKHLKYVQDMSTTACHLCHQFLQYFILYQL